MRRLHDASELLSPWQQKLWTRVVFVSSAGRSTTSWSTGRSSTRATWSLPAMTQVNQTFALSTFMFDCKTDFKIKRCLKSWAFSSSLPHIRPDLFLNHFHTKLSWQMDVCKRFSIKTAWFLHVIECRMWSDWKLCKYTVIDMHLSSCVWPFTLDEGNENEALPEPPNSQLSWKQGRQLLRQWVMSHLHWNHVTNELIHSKILMQDRQSFSAIQHTFHIDYDIFNISAAIMTSVDITVY